MATNPVFPVAGMITRLEFIGLKEEDFNYITGYENTTYCKCNPKYYEEILRKNNLKADEVVFFGNSEKDDYRNATEVGIKSYLVGDDIKWVDKKNKDLCITMNEIISKLPNKNQSRLINRGF